MTFTQYVISKDGKGSGGFLCPPGHWNHRYTLHGYELTPKARRRKRDPFYIGTIDAAISGEDADIPESVRERARKIRDAATLVCSELWLRHTYGYFRNSYSPDGVTADVSRSVRGTTAGGMDPAHHLAVMCVRRYFPDHEPRVDLIDAGPDAMLYGSWPCTRCGASVQYEARVDALVVFNVGSQVCPKGDDGAHAWE